jgi:O-antigen/teichoic acid export membrane protein
MSVLERIGLPALRGRGGGIVFIGDIVSKFLTFLITLLLLKLVTPTGYALYGVFITVLATVNQFTDSGLHPSFIRFYALYHETQPGRARAHLHFAVRVKLIVVALTGVALFLGADLLAVRAFRLPDLALPLRILSAGIVGSGIFEFLQSVFQARQQYASLTAMRVAEGGGKLGVILAAIALGAFSLTVVYAAYAAVPFVVAAVALARNPFFLERVRYDWRDIGREVLSFGKWMLLSSFATMFLMRLDVYMLTPMLAARQTDLGLYNAAVRLCTPLIVLCGSIVTIFFPKAMALRSLPGLRAYIRRTFQVTLPVSVLALLYLVALLILTPSVFPKYAGAMPYFVILWVGYVWTIVGNPLTILVLSLDRAKIATAINLAQLLLSILSHYVFISAMGALGAALSTVLMWFLFGTVSLWYLYTHRRLIETLPVSPVSAGALPEPRSQAQDTP